MAVYKSRRKDAAAQFVADARELRKATVRIARKFPASYKYVTTGPLLQLASEVYMNALKGNSIYVHKDMSERDYELRHRYLAAATASADALPIQERAIQKCLCKNLLTEVYSRSFIYDNSASLKDRGMDFQLRRLRKHLQDHYRRYGTEGGIYQFDFKNYFGSLPHEEIKRRARK